MRTVGRDDRCARPLMVPAAQVHPVRLLQVDVALAVLHTVPPRGLGVAVEEIVARAKLHPYMRVVFYQLIPLEQEHTGAGARKTVDRAGHHPSRLTGVLPMAPTALWFRTASSVSFFRSSI